MNTKVAIISDIHGNLEALNKVIKDIRKSGIRSIICLGDVVGYGPDPGACLDKLLEQDDIIFIMGNHESMILKETTYERCSNLGKISHKWTERMLDDCQIDSITQKFKQHYKNEEFLFTHASYPYSIDWNYAYNPQTYNDNFRDIDENIRFVFLGHTHRPQVYFFDNGTDKYVISQINKVDVFSFKRNSKDINFINVGSVGQGRAGETKASYVQLIVNSETVRVKYRKLRYRSFITYFKIIKRGLGVEIASFLIQENLRRRIYEHTYNWGQRFFRLIFKEKS